MQALIKFSYAEDIRLSHFTNRCVTQNRVKQGFTPNLKKARVNAVQGNRINGDKKSKSFKTPVESCMFYKFEGTLTQPMKDCLSEYGLCWYCRKGVHNAKTCPVKENVQPR